MAALFGQVSRHLAGVHVPCVPLPGCPNTFGTDEHRRRCSRFKLPAKITAHKSMGFKVIQEITHPIES